MGNSIVLGTAQMGMPYGIANKNEQPDLKEIESILQTAIELGIDEFDTAQGYGNCEEILGTALSNLKTDKNIKIISKPHPNLNHTSVSDMTQGLENTLKRLNISSLFGYMLHREDFLDLWEKGLGKIMKGFMENGLVENIGVSLYSPGRALQALKTDGITLVQIPSNVLDHRFERAGVFHLAQESGKTVYIRSIFLQGLLLMNPEHLPIPMQIAKPTLKSLKHVMDTFGLNQLELTMGYIKNAFPDAKVIFGAESAIQVTENMACWNNEFPNELVTQIQSRFQNVDEVIINPTLWELD